MKRTTNILLLVFLVSLAATVWAQNEKKNEVKKKPTAADTTRSKYPKFNVPVYLGHSGLMGGPVPKLVFDSLLKQGIYSRDSLGNVYKVDGFNFNYIERNLYEDSIGRLIVMPDYMFERCYGNMIEADIARSIYDRTKEGDTVYIDQIVLIRPDSGSSSGRTMKFSITK